MIINIGEIEKGRLKHAVLHSMGILNDRLRDVLPTCYPDQHDLSFYKKIEDELDMVKTFKVFLDKLDEQSQEGGVE